MWSQTRGHGQGQSALGRTGGARSGRADGRIVRAASARAARGLERRSARRIPDNGGSGGGVDRIVLTGECGGRRELVSPAGVEMQSPIDFVQVDARLGSHRTAGTRVFRQQASCLVAPEFCSALRYCRRSADQTRCLFPTTTSPSIRPCRASCCPNARHSIEGRDAWNRLDRRRRLTGVFVFLRHASTGSSSSRRRRCSCSFPRFAMSRRQ